MYVPFNTLSDQSKVWVYLSDRSFDEKEVTTLNKELEEFVSGWTAHSATLKASYQVLHNQFIVLAVDESLNDASGCSIDRSVHFMKSMEKKFNISLFDRTLIAFEDNASIKLYKISTLEEAIKAQELNNKSVFFNNLVTTLADFKQNWCISVSAESSFLKKYFIYA